MDMIISLVKEKVKLLDRVRITLRTNHYSYKSDHKNANIDCIRLSIIPSERCHLGMYRISASGKAELLERIYRDNSWAIEIEICAGL